MGRGQMTDDRGRVNDNLFDIFMPHQLFNIRTVFLGVIAFVLTFSTVCMCRAEGNDRDLDWSRWREMPVMDGGRRMPLDTFARETVRAVCGRETVRLTMDGQTKKFTAAELLFAWLAEPEKWPDADFLLAGNETLRKEILDLPARDEAGKRLRYVSPQSVEQAAKFAEKLEELDAARREAFAAGEKFTLAGADEAAAGLNKAYGVFRELSFDPHDPRADREPFFESLSDVVRIWRVQLAPSLSPWLELKQPDELGKAVDRVNRSLTQLLALYQKQEFSLPEAEEPANELCAAAAELNAYFRGVRNRTLEAENEDEKRLRQARAMVSKLAGRTKSLARLAQALRRSLFVGRRSLRVVPALDPWALELERDPMQAAQPWLSLQAVLYAAPETLQGYPADKLSDVRQAFAAAKAAYTDREAADRAQRFNEAMARFVSAMRELGETIEPVRQTLPIEKKDEALLAATAYPPPGFTDREILYNRLDPFFWSWVLTLASLAVFALGFGILRRAMFLLGIIVLFAGQALTVYGLWLRGSITGMIPVTNMFETVLFVGATVALLGIWFAVLPLLWPGLGPAWELTVLPWRTRLTPARVCMLLVRSLLTGAAVYLLAVGNFNPGGDGPVLALLPKSASGGLGGLSATLVLWAVGLPVFLWMAWFFPRAVPAAILGIAIAPFAIARQGFGKTVDESLARRVFAVSGAAVALVAYLTAYYAPGPVFNRGVGLEMAAVLRNNFWLAVHVLIITASYGAGALAWGLGNISLAYYAFGRYKKSQDETADDEKTKVIPRRPPQQCAVLARYTYRAVQLAVLLLAAGTITGAIWADFAWGRYWGWDPKEVWALVTLLVYMVILHGRWASWTGDFGMAVGAVLGATSIMMAWYGVNFILAGGLHSYGFGSGGQTPVLAIVACNWLFAILAGGRYYLQSLRSANE